MTLRLLPPLLAVVATCDLAAAEADYEAAIRAFARLRLAVLVDPEGARRQFCTTPAAPGASSHCNLTLRRGRSDDDAATCANPWTPGPPRYYLISAQCRLPVWAASLALPPLKARILR